MSLAAFIHLLAGIAGRYSSIMLNIVQENQQNIIHLQYFLPEKVDCCLKKGLLKPLFHKQCNQDSKYLLFMYKTHSELFGGMNKLESPQMSLPFVTIEKYL